MTPADEQPMIVVDASALTNALTDDGPVGARARAALSADPAWAAPAHVRVEVFSAIRGRWLGDMIAYARAVDALVALAGATVELVEPGPLLIRMWELRENVSGCDAAYIATAEALACPLVTADQRLAAAAAGPSDVQHCVP